VNILVLGASSVIGSEIAAALSPGHTLLLAGRDPGRLCQAAGLCRCAGAHEAIELPCDLERGSAALVEALGGRAVDVVVNAASATSRLRDDDIDPAEWSAYLRVELSAPLELVAALAARRSTPLVVVYISSILAVTPSPNRQIYGGLKALHEAALRRMARATGRLDVRIVRVGTIIDADRRTPRASALGRAVRTALDRGRPVVTYGASGRALAAAHRIHPLLFAAVVRAVRIARRLRRPRTDAGGSMCGRQQTKV